MHSRSFRTMLLFACLLSVFIGSGVLTVRAARPATQPEQSFQPSEHGIAIPHKINTATLPRVQETGPAATSIPSSVTNSQTQQLASQPLATVQNVVKVPAPTRTDSSANQGLSQQGGKPDANGAGGLDNYLETTNPGPSIYSRSGTHQQTSTYQSWFGVNSSFYDPVTVWDNIGDRFIFSVLQSSAQTIWLSVAQQANATGL